uniref:receptor-interacting serine/threonine-protein kinase 2-like n=1 Tax=Styela clava TaxID=7725 RepID=UPI00193AA465|nr:receptor-interacting serine/threonine-protein kinase 2-like [Styela clava]
MSPNGVGNKHEEEIPLIDFQSMKFVELIDSGGMADISLYEWNKNGSIFLVAKKSLFRGSMALRYRSNLKKEMAILSKLDHENIVRTYGAVQTDHDFGLVMEYHKFKSYLKFFHDLRDNIEETATIDKVLVPLKIKIISEIISAMNYLHNRSPPVLHLDLKSDNVLLDSELHAKLCDFGLSQMRTLNTLRSRSTVLVRSIAGTPGYIDPQRLADPKFKPTTKSDVYAFGILEWEILTDTLSYEGMNNEQIANHVIINKLRPGVSLVPQIFPDGMTNIMESSWAQEPSERPTFKELEDEIFSIIKDIPDYKGQVRQSRIQTLARHKLIERTSYDTQSSSQNLSIQERQPHSSYLNENRRQLNGGDLPQRPTSAPNCSAETKPMTVVDSNESRNSIDQSTVNESTPLLLSSSAVPRYVVEKKFMSIKKVLLVLALFLSFSAIASVGIIIWRIKVMNAPHCGNMSAPLHGNVTCSNESDKYNKKCNFVCDEGYGIFGKQTIVCIGGKWNDRKPVCEKACDPLNPISHGQLNCTNQFFVNSTCTVKCLDNHHIQGNNTLTCLQNGRWSNPEPSCNCPHCYVGDQCEYSISWKNVADTLQFMKPYEELSVNYGGHISVCTARIYKWFKFHGICQDPTARQSGSCSRGSGYDSPAGSAEHAAAELIRQLVKREVYPEPCDPQSMPTEC